ncbi:hypothetical protein [Gudongella sp. DL1XJH-153]|uniref:hypothetical protein n=1 Tax=Gudongella sp. DL1XJH-153 TaxID=3409804 RepID=UPI003BB756A8
MQVLSNTSKTINVSKNERASIDIVKIVAYIVLFDILFMPYFPYFIMPMSLPLVALMLLRYGKITNNIYLKLFSIIAVTIFISVFTSIVIGRSTEIIVENMKRAFQLLTTFAYFFYYQETLKRRDINIKKILMLFVIYQFVLSILFFIDPNYIVDLKNILYKSSSYAAENVLIYLRYSYMFVDPNTAAYFFLIVVFFVYSRYEISTINNFAVIIATVVLLFSFQSNGAILATIAGVFLNILLDKKLLKNKTWKSVIKLLFLAFIAIVFINAVFPELWSTTIDVIDRYIYRYERTVTSGNPRVGIYMRAISNLFPFLFGQGYTLFVQGEFFKPHSDHLRLIYSYGLVAYFSTVFFLFKNIFKKKYLFIIPAITAFTINTLVDEQKLFALFLILLAFAINNEKSLHEYIGNRKIERRD